MEMTWTKMGTFWIALSVFFSIVTPAVLAEEWTLLDNPDLAPVNPYSIWSEPHNCSGNIDNCTNGFTLSFKLLLLDKGNEDLPENYIISSGGQNSLSRGFYVRQRYGKLFEFGVALDDMLWEAELSLAWGSSSNIILTWSRMAGLSVYIDGFLAGSAPKSVERIFTHTKVDPFINTWIGKANDDIRGSGHPELHIGKVTIQDEVLTADDVMSLGEGYTGEMKVGCSSGSVPEGASAPTDSNGHSSSSNCRRVCHEDKMEVSLFKDNSCFCLSFEQYLIWSLSGNGYQAAPCDSSYDVIFAQHVIFNRSFLDVIDLEVDIGRPSDKAYIRPEETVTFKLSTGVESKVVFSVDFGDGTDLTTSDTTIGHAFSAAGSYHVEITAKTASASENVTSTVEIEDIDETAEPDPYFLRVDPNHEAPAGTVQAHMSSFSTVAEQCSFNPGDGRSLVKFNNDAANQNFVASHSETYKFNMLGIHQVSMVCSNEAGESTEHYTALSVNPDPMYESVALDDNTAIEIAISGADATNLKVIMNGKSLNYGSGYEILGEKLVLRRSAFSTPGEHVLQLMVNGRSLYTKTFNMQTAVQDITIKASPLHAKPNEDFTFEFIIKKGSNIHAAIDFGDGHKEMLYLSDVPEPYTILRSHAYADLGNFGVTLTVVNEVSAQTVSIQVPVQRHIEQVAMVAMNQTTLGQPTEFVFEIDMDKASAIPVQVEFDYDDGSEPSIVSLGQESDTVTPLTHRYTYAHYGIYHVRARVFNHLSSKVVYAIHQVGENLTLVDVRVAEDHVELGHAVELTFHIPRGSPIHLVVDMGDGLESIDYRSPGFYTSEKDCRVYRDEDNEDDWDDEEDDQAAEQTNLVNTVHSTEQQRRKRRYVIYERRPTQQHGMRRRRSVLEDEDFSGGSGTEDYTIDFSGELDESMLDKPRPTPTAPPPTVTPNNDIVLNYTYEGVGQYHVTVKVYNCFGEVESFLSPDIIVLPQERPSIACDEVALRFTGAAGGDTMPSYFRSKELSLVALSDVRCTYDEDKYSLQEYVTWTSEFETVYGEWRPSPDFSATEAEGTSINIPGNTYSYGVYKMTATLWLRLAEGPQGSKVIVGSGDSEDGSGSEGSFQLKSTGHYMDRSRTLGTLVGSQSVTTYFRIVPSPLYAHIKGQEDLQMFNNSVSVPIDISQSRDPDVNKATNRSGMVSFVFCFASALKDQMSNLSLTQLVDKSVPIARNREKTVYVFDLDSEWNNCFLHNTTVSVFDHDIRVLGLINNVDLHFLLVMTKDFRQQRTGADYKVMSVDLTDYDAMLDTLTDADMAKDPAAGISLCTHVMKSISNSGQDSGSGITKTVSKLLGKTEFLANYANSFDLVNANNDIVSQATSNKDLLEPDGQEKAAGTLDNAAHTATNLGETADADTIYNSFSTLGVGANNVLPYKDGDATSQVERHRRKRRSISEGVEPVHEMTCCERLYGLCEWIEPKTPGLREIFRKSEVWDEIMCDNQPPDDVKEYRERYDAMLDAEAAAAEAQDGRIAAKGMGSLSTMASLLGGKQSEGAAATIPALNLSVQKMEQKTINKAKKRRRRRKRRAAAEGWTYECNDFGDEDIADETCSHGTKFGTMCLPDSMVENMSTETSIMSMPKSKNMFSANGVNADVSTMEVSFAGKSQKVEGESCPIVIEITGKAENFKTEVGHTFVDSEAKKQDWSYRTVPIVANDTVLYVTLKPENADESYEIAVAYEDFANDTNNDFITQVHGHGHPELVRKRRAALNSTDDLNKSTSKATSDTNTEKEASSPIDVFENINEYYAYTVRIPANVTERAGNYTIGIRGKSAKMLLGEATKRNITYHFGTYTHKCQYWDKVERRWSNAGCKVASNSNPFVTRCLCNHLTSFGGDMVVPPNTINFNTVFSLDNFVESLPVFFTVVLALLAYIITLIWARREDKKDLIKWGATPLEDNLPSDTYHYQVTVNTAVKKKAATRSKVSFILSGDDGDTGVRRLYDGKRKEFPSGSIYNFVLSVENCLGPLTYLRIWHDNSGKGKHKSWYLDQVQVTDLQTGDRFFFLVDRWLAVEEDDGQVERIVPVAGMNDLSAFKHLFSSSFRKKLTNDHMWFSVVSRPTRSSFTRVQRVSCCVALLFLTMITNCMFFRADENQENVKALKLGPIQFTLHQVFISVVTTCIVFPPSLAIVTIFRKARPKKNTIQQENQKMSQKTKKFQWKSVTPGSAPWGNVKRSRVSKLKDSVRNILNSHLKAKYKTKDPDANKLQRKKKKGFSLPHWTNYIAWTLVFFSIVASGFFTILYSMEWGREKSLDWLTTFLLSFFQNVVVVQPVKVLLLAAFISCIMRKPDLDDEEETFDDHHAMPVSNNDPLSCSQIDLQEMIKQRQLAASEIAPPDTESLQKARDLRMKEMAMESILKECIVYVFFVLVLFFLSYETRDSNSFIFAQNIKNTFIETSPSFSGISRPENFWEWTKSVLLPNLYSSDWYNGRPLTWDEALQMDDRYTIRVGVARFRQLRITENSCDVEEVFQPLINHCRSSYSWVDDDVDDYFPGWKKPIGNQSIDDMETSSWVYRNSFELKSAPYMGYISNYKGGGYTFSFLRNPAKTAYLIDELETNGWLDPRTRGLFLEFTLYNANINLFGSVIMLLEFMDTGAAISKTEIKVFRLSSYVGGYGIIVIIFEVLYACFTIYFFVNMVKQLRKKKCKYFKDVWDMQEFATLVMSIIVIIMYILKKLFGAAAMHTLEESGSGEYVNFVTIATWDELFGFMLAIVVFLATVKFIKMLKFNRRMGMMGDTIAYCVKDLKIFSVTFLIYYLAFCMMAYKLFGPQLELYSSFLTTIESLFAFALGSFDFDSLRAASCVGPLFFFLYVAVVQIGLMSMFLTIICDGFAAIKEETEHKSNDYEIVDFIWGKVKGMFGQS